MNFFKVTLICINHESEYRLADVGPDAKKGLYNKVNHNDISGVKRIEVSKKKHLFNGS